MFLRSRKAREEPEDLSQSPVHYLASVNKPFTATAITIHAEYNQRTVANFEKLLAEGQLQEDIEQLGEFIRIEVSGTEIQVSPDTPSTSRWIWDHGELWTIFEYVDCPASLPLVDLEKGNFAAASVFMHSAISFSLIELKGKPTPGLTREDTPETLDAVRVE